MISYEISEKYRMSNRDVFGDYVRQRRNELNLSLRYVAQELEITPAYLSDIEQGNRQAPCKLLDRFIKILQIEEDKQQDFIDLAFQNRNICAPDLIEYLIANKMARVAIRSAIEENISGEELFHLVQNRKEKTNDINWIFTKLSSNN